MQIGRFSRGLPAKGLWPIGIGGPAVMTRPRPSRKEADSAHPANGGADNFLGREIPLLGRGRRRVILFLRLVRARSFSDPTLTPHETAPTESPPLSVPPRCARSRCAPRPTSLARHSNTGRDGKGKPRRGGERGKASSGYGQTLRGPSPLSLSHHRLPCHFCRRS